MLCTKSNRSSIFAGLVALGVVIAVGSLNTARAQVPALPPTSIPAGGPLGYDPNAVAFNGWEFYPTLNFLVENSNNYFTSPEAKLAGWAYGVSPTMTAEWSNGIHSTTLYGNFQQLQYPPDNQVPQESKINALSGEATWTQQYAPLRDLNFTFVGDYGHQTLATGLTNAIPSAVSFTGTTVLPNGNIQLPNGTIVSPSGQVVGQASPTVTSTPFTVVNPYDTFTGSASVQKLFSYGIVNLGVSVLRQQYEQATIGTPSFTAKTATETSAFWLGPLFYAYSEGSFSIHDDSSTPSSTAYRVIGGIGTRQFGLFRASAYFGHQGSQASGSEAAGGNVFGAALLYYPTSDWTIGAHVDELVNLAPPSAPPSTLALGLAAITPVQVGVTNTINSTTAALSSDYRISPQWSANTTFSYLHIQYIDTPSFTDTWLADASLRYDIWRDMTLAWHYQYSSIVSNLPLTSANRNLITMSASYRF